MQTIRASHPHGVLLTEDALRDVVDGDVEEDLLEEAVVGEARQVRHHQVRSPASAQDHLGIANGKCPLQLPPGCGYDFRALGFWEVMAIATNKSQKLI